MRVRARTWSTRVLCGARTQLLCVRSMRRIPALAVAVCGNALRTNYSVGQPSKAREDFGNVETLGLPAELDHHGEDSVSVPPEIQRKKTHKIPDTVPRDEATLTSVPAAASLQQWFLVPLFVLLFVVVRSVCDPFNSGELFYRRDREDTYAAKEERKGKLISEDADARRAELRRQLGG